MADILITGGTIVDGTGNPGYRAAVAVEQGRVRVIRGTAELPEASRTIDATGLVVAPGFIDLHSHSALMVQAEPDHLPKVTQGVTTEVIGIDGNSFAPFRDSETMRDFVRMYSGLEGHPAIAYDWDSVASFLTRFDHTVSVNIALMIGNSPLRICAMGWDDEPADQRAVTDMRAMLREGLQEGAFGLSTGLDYPPGCYASTDELVALGAEAGKLGGFYHTHLRNSLGDRFLDPIREAVEICHRGELPLHLTHLYQRPNAPSARPIFDLIDAAKSDGVEVSFDTYPYEWSSTTVLIKLPQWVQSGGPDALLANLRDDATRQRIRDDIEAVIGYEAWCREQERMRLMYFRQPANQRFEGMTLTEIARSRKLDVVDTLCELLVDEDLAISSVSPGPTGLTLSEFVTHPESMVGTDSIFLGSHPSPRTYGSYPRILGDLVREERRLSLAEAVRKMTSYPAQRLGILDRGILRDGMVADVTIFDFERIRPRATYDDPRQYSEGVEYVLVNGTVVLDQGKHTGAHPGRSLRRGRRT